MSDNIRRYIGIRHRTKRTADGEARPTQVAILQGGKVRKIDLETEDDELDFLLARLPASWRMLADGEDVPSGVLARHVKETAKGRKIPETYDGFKAGDTIAVVAGELQQVLTAK